VKSAQQQLEQAQRRLANLLSRSKPLFPKDYAKNLEAAQTDVEYWTAQAAAEQQAAVNLFAPTAAPAMAAKARTGRSTRRIARRILLVRR